MRAIRSRRRRRCRGRAWCASEPCLTATTSRSGYRPVGGAGGPLRGAGAAGGHGARLLSQQGPFTATESLRQTIDCAPEDLSAVLPRHGLSPRGDRRRRELRPPPAAQRAESRDGARREESRHAAGASAGGAPSRPRIRPSRCCARSASGPDGAMTEEILLRLDKWLWYARFCKSRTLAAKLCASGRIHLDGAIVQKPHHQVRAGQCADLSPGAPCPGDQDPGAGQPARPGAGGAAALRRLAAAGSVSGERAAAGPAGARQRPPHQSRAPRYRPAAEREIRQGMTRKRLAMSGSGFLLHCRMAHDRRRLRLDL